MLQKFKNIKIKNSIIIMGIITIFFNLMLAFLAYNDMNSINKNVTAMYQDRLLPIAHVGKIRADFLTIRMYANKLYIKYDKKYEDKMNEMNEDIQKQIKIYEKMNMDTKEETECINKLKSDYLAYTQEWDTLRLNLSKGRQINKNDYENFSTIGDNIEYSIKKLVEHDVKVADNLKIQSDKIYNRCIKTFGIIVIVVVALFIVISYGITKVIKKSSNKIISDLNKVANGDFSIKVHIDNNNEFGIMKIALIKTIKQVSGLIKNVQTLATNVVKESENLSASSEEMAASSQNVTEAIQDISKGTNSQADDLVKIAQDAKNVSDKIDKSNDVVQKLDLQTKNINDTSQVSRKEMKELINSMDMVMDSFKQFITKINGLDNNVSKINEITNLINSIADQTNLLALNAAIEAARAGEAGKGFSVVAEEIRKLAEQSKDSSENINNLIANISSDTSNIVEGTTNINEKMEKQREVANKSMRSFKEIIDAVKDMVEKMDTLNGIAKDLEKSKDRVEQKIDSASSVSQEISASSEEIAASSEEMSSSTEEIANSAQSLNEMTKKMMKEASEFKI